MEQMNDLVSRINQLYTESPGRAIQAGWRAGNATDAQVQVKVADGGLCHTVRLAGPVEGIDAIEPLRIVLDVPLEDWEIVHLGGGGCETVTPPVAYAPHRAFGLTGRHTIGREIGLWCSNFFLPMALARTRDASAGFFVGMEWSGDWRIVLEPAGEPSGSRSAVSLRIPTNQLCLEQGETLELPRAHFVAFSGSWEQGYAAARRYVRRQISPPWPGGGRVGLVSYNSWDGIGDKVCRDNLLPQISAAARLGVEVFTHDACWFGGGFPEGVGNYETHDATRWPEGLAPLAREVRAAGMKFGLWFELERTVANGEAFARRPELFLGRNPDKGPGQSLLLDLSRKQARDWAVETLARWIEPLGVEWIKWDFNFEPHAILRQKDPTGKYVFEYVRGLHEVLDRTLERFPDLHMETCASGGRRFDLGLVRRSHTVWMSDHTDNAWNCRWMQFHANTVLPGQLLARSVPMGEQTSQSRFAKTQLLSRMMGRLQLDGWISKLSEDTLESASGLIHWYKEVRHLVLENYIPLTPTPQRPVDALAAAFVRDNGSEALVFAFAGDEPVELEWSFPRAAGEMELLSVAGGNGPRSRQGQDPSRHHLRLCAHEAQGLHYIRKES